MGTIAVHEFITMDGVIEDPSWSFDYSFDPKMVEAIGAIMGSSKAILLGRRTYQEFAPSWSIRTAEDDPGAPLMNETPKYVVSASRQARIGATPQSLAPIVRTRSLISRTGSMATSTSVAAGPWSGRCSPTAWSTSCTCSSIRCCSAPVSDCLLTPVQRLSSRSPDRRPTATESCTSPTPSPLLA